MEKPKINEFLDAPLAVINIGLDNFADEYLKGRTPNPCVRCNSFIKWDTFIEQADLLGAKYIATGHYAQIKTDNNNYTIEKGVDCKKDQAYVLWGIPKETLKRTILPLGDLTKEEVRNIARKHKLETAETPESMEICFIADNNYKRFINEYAKNKTEKIRNGKTLNEGGEVIGENDGYINYTIGQRKGIGLTNPDPLYVKKIDANSNTITVSEKKSLFKNKCKVSKINWLIDTPSFPLNLDCQIRYNGYISKASIDSINQDYIVSFDFNSLYPNIMISLNLSPETKMGRFEVDGDNITVLEYFAYKFITKYTAFVRGLNILIYKHWAFCANPWFILLT